jgi:hypothetical protein
MKAPIALFCKSYHTDLKRVQRLFNSIERLNEDDLPCYLSVPSSEIPLFRSGLAGIKVNLVADESIISCNPNIDPLQLANLPGHVSQQIVKSEFWRLNHSDAYLCLDSDAVFIRPIKKCDFLLPNDHPYTVMDQCHEFLFSAILEKKNDVVKAFFSDVKQLQVLFDRQGKAYSFGPFPVIWHKSVWESLEKNYLLPKGLTLLDAILDIPLESHWYGESLLKYKAIELMPCQPLFKVYHYAWQFDKELREGIDDKQLSQIYHGVIRQSSWEREMDWPEEGGGIFSRIGRKLRRRLGRI